jgi:hypothetical protein
MIETIRSRALPNRSRRRGRLERCRVPATIWTLKCSSPVEVYPRPLRPVKRLRVALSVADRRADDHYRRCTGTAQGIPVSPEMVERLKAAGLAAATPPRGANASAGNATTPGTRVSNVVQQDFLASVATRAVLPLFAARNKPFILVFWSCDQVRHRQSNSQPLHGAKRPWVYFHRR